MEISEVVQILTKMSEDGQLDKAIVDVTIKDAEQCYHIAKSDS